MQKQSKRIIAALLAAAMTVPMTVSISAPMQVSAGEILGETSFDYKMFPWCPVESYGAKQRFDLDDGAAHISILKAEGSDSSQWDLQFRHRGLKFKKDHVYKVSFKAKAQRSDMEFCTYIGDYKGDKRYFILNGATNKMVMGPDMGGEWGSIAKFTTEYQTFSGTFVPTSDIDEAEWTFRYAMDKNFFGGNAINGDEIWFDDMTIECITCDECNTDTEETYGYRSRRFSGLQNNYISVNQLGYFPMLAKTATLSDNQGDITQNAETITFSGSYDYEIVSVADDTVVYTGKTGRAVRDYDSGDTVCKIDFSEFEQTGEYYIRIKDKEWRSSPFKISSSIYSEEGHNLLTNALNFFYQSRAGADIKEEYITSGDEQELAFKRNRDDSLGYIQSEWHNDSMVKADDVKIHGSSKIDTGGGWYSGSDFNKSMTESGFSVWTLQNMYEIATRTNKGEEKFADDSGTVIIPENGNQVPDILDECRYELDYMAKMKVQPNEATWGDFAGLYYHGAQGVGFVPQPLNYELEYQAMYAVQPPTFAATLHYAACAAQGARLWAPYDAEYAAELLQNAKDAYQAYKEYRYDASSNEEENVQSLYAHQKQNGVKISDGDTDVSDEAYWAACELYISAKEMEDTDAETYLAEMTGFENAFKVLNRIFDSPAADPEGSFTTFNRTCTTSAGSMSLLLHTNLLENTQYQTLKTELLNTADNYIQTKDEQGYGIPYKYDGPGYVSADAATMICCGYEYGSNERALNNMIAMAYAYHLTCDQKYLNGIATGMNYLLGNNPMALSFITGYGDYHTENPAHRYWIHELDDSYPAAPDGVLVSGPNAGLQDPYMRALGFASDNSHAHSQRYYADSVEAWSSNNASLTCNASLAWIVSFMQDRIYEKPAPTLGDTDADGRITDHDAVALNNYLLGTGTLNSAEAADLNHDGKLNAVDLTMLKQFLLS